MADEVGAPLSNPLIGIRDSIYGGGSCCEDADICYDGGDVECDEGECFIVTRAKIGGAESTLHIDSIDEEHAEGGGKKRGGKDSLHLESKENCNECSIAVEGRDVCSGEEAMIIVRKFVDKKSTAASETSISSSATNNAEIVAQAKVITDCETEECALRKIAQEEPEARKTIAQNIADNFLVSGPADTMDWLDNTNIDRVLDQLVKKHPTMYHMNFHMINFADPVALPSGARPNMRTIDMVKDVIQAGKDMFCVVINTDRYGKSGIHWFCIFCDFRSGGTSEHPFTIEYFNSSGARARTEIAQWMIATEKAIERARNPAGHPYHCKHVTAATVQHQIDTDSECGVYSLYYIWRRLKGNPISEFSTRIPDSRMIAFRKKLFKNRPSIQNPEGRVVGDS